MAIWAEELEVLERVVAGISIDVVKLQRQRLPSFVPATKLAALLLQSGREQPKLYVLPRPVPPSG